jgi:NAD(P)-dependent dehydrogenase (short-subunit alcohol dehydrogenase family)
MPMLSGKVAVVTGGALGIGKAIAKRFGQEGAHVAIWDTNEEAARESEESVRKEGVNTITVVADVADRTQVAAALESTQANLGAVDILVNNVGIFNGFFNFLDIPEEAWHEVLRVNVDSAFICSQLVGRHMVEKKIEGRIINIGSVDGGIAYGDFAQYSTSKAAMRMLSKASAMSLARHKITVNEIAPGFILTEMSRFVIETPVFQGRAESFAPIGRAGATEEIAAAAAFLASSEAAYITGTTLTVDGGSIEAGRTWIQHQYLVEDGFITD